MIAPATKMKFPLYVRCYYRGMYLVRKGKRYKNERKEKKFLKERASLVNLKLEVKNKNPSPRQVIGLNSKEFLQVKTGSGGSS
jgi:hypothetical protein